MLISSVTDIVDMISYVFIGFVSISLVVSSIMIGIITYISVLERTKEKSLLEVNKSCENYFSFVIIIGSRNEV